MKRRLMIMLLVAGVGVVAKAQPDDTVPQASSLLCDYQYVKRTLPWLAPANAAWLTRYRLSNASQAELSLTHARGGQTDFYESPRLWQGTASVESVSRLNSRTVVSGHVAYDNYSGRDMAGSVFILHPSASARHLPFDIVEDSLGNTGRKHRDTYRLGGAVGIDLWHGVAAGLSMEYTAANYAKYKDLRHKNKFMDMQFAAGIYVPLGRTLQVGGHYQYRRTTESVVFSTYGKDDRTYMSFINYGPFIGLVEQFGASGYTDRSREMPLVSDYDGAGLQLALRIDSHTELLAAGSYAHRRGYYGRPSPYTITYTRHRSSCYDYAARLARTAGSTRLSLDLAFQAENLQNKARTYRELQNDAGATYYEYYTPVKTADRLWMNAAVAATADWGISGLLPAWTIRAAMDWNRRKQTAYLFPYGRRQQLTVREYSVSVCRRLPARRGVWSLQAGASFREGSGLPFDDFTLATPSDKATEPATMDACLWREYQWLTAPQYAVDAAVRYSFVLPGTDMKTYVGVALQHRKANRHYEYSQGPDRTTVSVAVGCEF